MTDGFAAWRISAGCVICDSGTPLRHPLFPEAFPPTIRVPEGGAEGGCRSGVPFLLKRDAVFAKTPPRFFGVT